MRHEGRPLTLGQIDLLIEASVIRFAPRNLAMLGGE